MDSASINRGYERMKKSTKVRTKGGICLGVPVPIDGRTGIHVTQGKKEEDLLPEDIVEAITGRKVAVILYQDEADLMAGNLCCGG